ncbi:unnamed protein product [Musa acuminata var. zebrina]
MSVVNLSKAINWLHQVNSIPSLEVLYLGWASLPYIPSHLPPFNLTSIVKLDLFGYSNLNTTILRWLSHASSLVYLDLSYCSLVDIESLQVTLGALSNLKELYLLGNRLEGEIFGMIMNVSRSLKYLDLSWNSLSGDMGQILRSLGSLEYLALDYNKFDGDISEIVKIFSSSLRYLSLSSNHITGKIPQTMENLTNLEYLDLSENNIIGGIPTVFGNLINLKSLDLSQNKISGQIPETMENLTNLEYLYLSNNNIIGDIPTVFGNLINLKSLDLSENNISGQIPETIGNLINLEYLDLSDNNIIGGISIVFGNLINLEDLNLLGNKISGQIPKTIGNLTNLKYLDISFNNIIGGIPMAFGNLLCNLSFIDLSHNHIGGELTDLIDSLLRCEKRAALYLSISGNNLSGIVPLSMGQLSALSELDISSNFLEGNITEAHFSKLTKLEHLDISYNSLNVILPNDWLPPFNANLIIMSSCHLGTKFPAWIQTQTYLEDLSLSGVGLSGNLPTWFPDILKGWVKHLDLSNNSLDGPIPLNFANASGLQILSLSHNNLNGGFPSFSAILILSSPRPIKQ